HLHRVRGDYNKAEQFFRRGLDTLGATLGLGHPYAAELLSGLGYMYAEQDEYAKAGEMLERALTMRRHAVGEGHPHYALSLVYLADLRRRQGRFAEAESLLNQALAVYRRKFDERHPYTAAVLSHLSPVLGALGNFEKAEEAGELALAIRRESLGDGHVDTATSVFNLAELHWLQGRFTEARGLFQQVLPVLKKAAGPRHPSTARALYYLGLFHLNRKEPLEAEDLLWQSLNIREQALRPGHQETVESVRALSRLYEAHAGMPKADAFLQKGLALVEKTPDTDGLAATRMLNDIGGLLRLRRDVGRAESFFRRAITLNEKAAEPDRFELAISLNSLAMLDHGRGNLDGAERLYRRALDVLEQAQQQRRPWFGGILKNLSGLYGARGDVARAVEAARRADEVEEYNLGLMLARGSENQNRAFWITLNESTAANISLHLRVAPNSQEAARLAFETVLRRKGRVLDGMIASRRALRASRDEKDRANLARLEVARSRLAAQVAAYPERSGAGYDPKALAKLEEEYQRLEAAVSAGGAASGEQSPPVNIESVRKLIPEGAALVEFAAYDPVNFKARTARETLVEPRYAAYVLHHDGRLAWADLGDAFEIDGRTWDFRVALRNPGGKDVRASARAVDEKVMRPVRQLLAGARWLLVSPDVTLHLIPFEALIDEQGRYLTESFLFTYLNSARELSRLQQRPPGGNPPLLVANPDFNLRVGEDKQAPTESAGRQPARPAGFTFTPLPGSEEEADRIAKILPGAQVLKGPAATEAALKQSRAPSILHIATHAFFPETVPWGTSQDMSKVPGNEDKKLTQSLMNIFLRFYQTREGIDHVYSLSQTGIVLAGANTRRTPGGEDGILTAFELSGLDLWGTRLVVLSACETAVGDVERGNGVYGLKRALALAGAESQVMSLWKVDDETTRAIMVRFYTRLRAGEGRSEALRQIRLEILKSQDYSHPYYWAGFIQSGDWRSIDTQSN
ncbi:MAG TPA: CHAT domain-containing tetratricopeptide repeat protein, partial [Pyrinomonadaceae bacterium]